MQLAYLTSDVYPTFDEPKKWQRGINRCHIIKYTSDRVKYNYSTIL